MRNGEIAEAFEELASLYELDGAVVYRVVAYRNAAKAIREAGVSVEELAKQGRADELAGVGKTIAEKIDALLETGSIPSADKLKQRIPPGLVEITRIPGLGPKRARLLHDELGVSSIDELRQAAEDGRLSDVKGFGKKAEENLLAAFAAGADGRPKARMLLSKALPVGEELVAALREHPAAIRVELAGSARRLADTVKDLDIVAASSDPAALAEAFSGLDAIESVSTSGEAGAKALTHTGLPVDLRIVPEEAFGNLLHHFTGSGRHNEALRTEAVRRGLHVSEYGISDDETGESEAFKTEEEVYERLGMQYIPPELRENRGELEAARERRLPELVTLADLKGDLHMHTDWSDGRGTLEEMVLAAKERGRKYIAICDHARRLRDGRLERQTEEIAAMNERVSGITVLAGIEVDIRGEGSLDYDDEALAQRDWVMASIHSGFDQPRERLTDRLVAAMENPHVDCIGHPTGRKINRRPPYELDLERVFEKAVETGTFLEINAQPDRLDLTDNHARAAVEAGVRIVVSTDAHRVHELDNLQLGVAQARRGWVTADQIVNTRTWAQIKKLMKKS
jgi:DNA polymerase (family 10)